MILLVLLKSIKKNIKTIMSENFFKVIRAGINTTFQDLGRNNLNHIGIPISGVMDRRNYIISNKILQNVPNHPAIQLQ